MIQTFKHKKEGRIIRLNHLQSPVDIEYTLCGMAFDCNIDNDDAELISQKENGIVTCLTCCRIITALRNFPAKKLKHKNPITKP